MYHLYLSHDAVRDTLCFISTCHLMLWGMQYVSSLPVTWSILWGMRYVLSLPFTWCCEGCSMYHLYLSHDAVRDAVCIISYLSHDALRDAVCIISTCHLMLRGMRYVSSLPVTWCCEGCSMYHLLPVTWCFEGCGMYHLYLSHDAVRDAVCIISYLSHDTVRDAVCIISTCHLMLWGRRYVSSLPVTWCCEGCIMFHLYLSHDAVRDAECIISTCHMMLWGMQYVSSLPVTCYEGRSIINSICGMVLWGMPFLSSLPVVCSHKGCSMFHLYLGWEIFLILIIGFYLMCT